MINDIAKKNKQKKTLLSNNANLQMMIFTLIQIETSVFLIYTWRDMIPTCSLLSKENDAIMKSILV